MSLPTVVVIAHLVTTSKEAQDQILGSLHTIVENSRNNEPGTLKYAVCVPDTSPPNAAQNANDIYVIEEYTNKTAFDAHMSSSPVVELLDTFKTTTPPLLQPTTKLYTVGWISGALLSRPDRLPSQAAKTEESDLQGRIDHPYVLFATITDPDARDIDSLEPYGAAIVKYATENEPDTIFYGDARPLDMTSGKEMDALSGDALAFICAVEVYASKEACEAHLQDESVKTLGIEGNQLGSKFQIVPMILKEGWLVRE